MSETRKGIRPSTIILLVILIAIVVVPLFMYGLEAEFAGTDGAGPEMIEAGGYTPWWDGLGIFPQSAELQSGLFALQAALGAGVLGYALGVLRERRRNQRAMAAEAVTASATLADAPARA